MKKNVNFEILDKELLIQTNGGDLSELTTWVLETI